MNRTTCMRSFSTEEVLRWKQGEILYPEKYASFLKHKMCSKIIYNNIVLQDDAQRKISAGANGGTYRRVRVTCHTGTYSSVIITSQ